MICKCTQVSVDDIKAMAQSDLQDWYDASQKCGAGRYCGGCLRTFRKKFAEARRVKNKIIDSKRDVA